MDFREKINVKELNSNKFGLVRIAGIGTYFYTDTNFRENFVLLERKEELLPKFAKFANLVTNMTVDNNIVIYTKKYIELLEEYESDLNEYNLTLAEENIPSVIMDRTLATLGLHSIDTEPTDSYIILINFLPYEDVGRHTISYNFRYESEDRLRKKLSDHIWRLPEIKGISNVNRIQMIASLVTGKIDEILQRDEVKVEDTIEIINIKEKNILNKLFKKKNIKHFSEVNNENFVGSKTELELAKYNDFASEFFTLAYKNNLFKLGYYKLGKLGDNIFTLYEYREKSIKFNGSENLITKFLELEVFDEKIQDILSDKDKADLIEIFNRKYLTINYKDL